MADRKPVKVLPDGGGDSTGLGEFVAADTVGVADGGTGAVTAGAALTALGASPTAGNSSLITLGTIGTGVWQGTDVGIAHGGTGASTAGAALTALGASPTAGNSSLTTLGTIGTGVWQGTDVGIAHGGTGASTASAARSNLGVADLTVSSTLTGKDIAADTGQNIKKVILVDLTDPGTMWDVQAFLARARWTSWYEELGAPPMRGAMWINNATTTVIWWNLDTDALYMSFTLAANQGIPSAGAKGLAFLDGRLYTANGPDYGVGIVDFLTDNLWTYWTGGEALYRGGIKERNDTLAFNTLRATPAIVSMGANDIAPCRDLSLVDEFGRPTHWWAVSTATKISVYSPVDDAIYDSLLADNGSHALKISPGGIIIVDTYSGDDWVDAYDIFTVTTDDFVRSQQFYPDAAGNRDGASTPHVTSGDKINDVAVLDSFAPSGGPIIVMATDDGLGIYYERTKFSGTGMLRLHITSSYNILMGGSDAAGSVIGAWPLTDVNDRSGNGLTLTASTSAPTFAAGPLGFNASVFNGSSQYYTRTANFAFTTAQHQTYSWYFKTTTDANPSAQEVLVHVDSTTPHCYMTLETSGAIKLQMRNDASNTYYVTSSGTGFADGKWHHMVAVVDYNVLEIRLYGDGVLLGTQTSIAASGFTHTKMAIADHTEAGVGPFDGSIAQLSINRGVWTEDEIRLEYQRMVRGLGGATAVLANTNVGSVRVDQNTGLVAITTAANQVEIWDAVTGLRESINAVTTATLNSADVRSPVGADDPLYIAGRSGQFEVVAPDRRVLG